MYLILELTVSCYIVELREPTFFAFNFTEVPIALNSKGMAKVVRDNYRILKRIWEDSRGMLK